MASISQRVASQWIQAQLLEAALERQADISKRLMSRIMAEDQTFGNLSAHREKLSRKENKDRMRRLHAELERRGYKPIPTYSTWTDDKSGNDYGERSYLVPDARPEDMFELGREFEQDSVIYKSKDGTLGMYYTGDKPRAMLAQDNEGRPAFMIQPEKSPKKEQGSGPRKKEREEEELFSRSRGLNFSFEFDWDTEYPFDGETPIDKQGEPDPVDLGTPSRVKEKTPREDPAKGWDAYLAKVWDKGHRQIPNTNVKTRERFPRVEMLTLMKTDPKFRHYIREDYKRRRQQERSQASPAVG